MSVSGEIDLALGILDHQLVDSDGRRCGKVDELERLGLGAPRSLARLRAHDVVPWSAVVRADRRGVIVRHGTKPK